MIRLQKVNIASVLSFCFCCRPRHQLCLFCAGAHSVVSLFFLHAIALARTHARTPCVCSTSLAEDDRQISWRNAHIFAVFIEINFILNRLRRVLPSVGTFRFRLLPLFLTAPSPPSLRCYWHVKATTCIVASRWWMHNIILEAPKKKRGRGGGG